MLLINRRRVLGFGLLVFLAWATYAGSLGNDFVWDDTGYILDTPELRHPENVRLIIDPELYFSRFQEGSWRPLVTLSHFFSVGLFRYWAPGHNALDLFLYTLVVLLVFGLALQMGMRGRAALIAAALFAVHPVHVESVMVSGLRSDVLCALFLLSAFLCIIKADQGSRAGAWWAGAIGLYALGLLSKEVALVFPFLVLAYDGAIARQRKAPLEPDEGVWAPIRRAAGRNGRLRPTQVRALRRASSLDGLRRGFFGERDDYDARHPCAVRKAAPLSSAPQRGLPGQAYRESCRAPSARGPRRPCDCRLRDSVGV